VESVGRPEEERGFYTLAAVVVFLDITGKSFTTVYPLTHILFQTKWREIVKEHDITIFTSNHINEGAGVVFGTAHRLNHSSPYPRVLPNPKGYDHPPSHRNLSLSLNPLFFSFSPVTICPEDFSPETSTLCSSNVT
jgi:hypothetical protein